MKGTPPTVAVEYARRAIPGHVRPSFQEAESHIKNRGGAAAAAGGTEAPAAAETPAA
jgi:chemotaxis protein MotA